MNGTFVIIAYLVFAVAMVWVAGESDRERASLRRECMRNGDSAETCAKVFP